MRKNLKLLRVNHLLTQAQISEKIGCTRATYSSVESGKRNGSHNFWRCLQNAFNIPDEDLWGYMKNAEE